MRDFTGIAFALGVVVMVALVAAVVRPLLAKIGVVRDGGDRVDDADGYRTAPSSVAPKKSSLCSVCKKKDATLRQYKWVRDDGVLDLVRRWFGAAPTLRVGRDSWGDSVCCETCDPMARARFLRHHALDVADAADFRTKLERRRARFETVGWVEEVRTDVREHDREVSPNNVVALESMTTEKERTG